MTTVPEDALPEGLGRQMDVQRMALAVLDEPGLVACWTAAAEHLVGYSDKEILNLFKCRRRRHRRFSRGHRRRSHIVCRS
ncbi:hypothetical protein [Streptomyces sp. NPDC046909]|uniref:hypothetical protein n=1 Tax=Streptomyces sp. NPDC046909 TaxID=3155617 RepID=UPI0033FF4691